jgi:hypothetical protein
MSDYLAKTIKTYKNRKLDVSKPVELYRCLNRKGFTFSVRQNGLVVGHTSNIILRDCDLIVNESGKDRCITSKTRNVHAFVRGLINDEVFLEFSFLLRYEPYIDLGFYYKVHDEKIQITKVKCVYLADNKIYCQI